MTRLEKIIEQAAKTQRAYSMEKAFVAGDFDNEAFYEWCRQQTQPIFISEYSMPDDFECIAQFKVKQLMSAKGGGHAIEKLFTLKH